MHDPHAAPQIEAMLSGDHHKPCPHGYMQCRTCDDLRSRLLATWPTKSPRLRPSVIVQSKTWLTCETQLYIPTTVRVANVPIDLLTRPSAFIAPWMESLRALVPTVNTLRSDLNLAIDALYEDHYQALRRGE